MTKSQQQQQNIIRHTKKQGSIAQLKQQKKSPETDSREMQSYELPENELKITINKMFTELKQNTNKWLMEIGEIMHEQNENINKESEIMQKNQMEILSWKIQ